MRANQRNALSGRLAAVLRDMRGARLGLQSRGYVSATPPALHRAQRATASAAPHSPLQSSTSASGFASFATPQLHHTARPDHPAVLGQARWYATPPKKPRSSSKASAKTTAAKGGAKAAKPAAEAAPASPKRGKKAASASASATPAKKQAKAKAEEPPAAAAPTPPPAPPAAKTPAGEEAKAAGVAKAAAGTVTAKPEKPAESAKPEEGGAAKPEASAATPPKGEGSGAEGGAAAPKPAAAAGGEAAGSPESGKDGVPLEEGAAGGESPKGAEGEQPAEGATQKAEGFEAWYPSPENPNIPNAEEELKKAAKAAKAAKRKGAGRAPEVDEKEKDRVQDRVILTVVAVGIVGYLIYSFRTSRPLGEEIDWEKLIELIKAGQVFRIEVHDRARAQIVTTDAQGQPSFFMMIGDSEVFEYKIEALQAEFMTSSGEGSHSIPIVYRTHDHGVMGVLWQCSLPLILLYFLYFKVPRVQKSIMSESRPGGDKKFKFEKETNVTTTFKQVAGLKETKQEIMEVVDFLKSPDKYNRLGAKIPKGVLLTGPPGVGKTLLAKATAGESGVPFFSVSGSDFMEVYVGVGPARVRELFKAANKESPCIVFIDEIDAIGRKRHTGGRGSNNSEQESTLNSILVEMDGFGSRSGVVVLAGTNRADILDKALLRPGRFDRQVALDKPPLADRIEIFVLHLKPITVHPGVKKPKIAERLAALTPGFSGADIMNTCNEAALIAARANKDFVSMSDFEGAIEKILGGLKKEKKISTKEKRMIAFHEAGHVVTGWHLKHTDPVLKVSIVPRGGEKLGYTQHLPKDKYLSTQEEIEETMVKLLGGRVSEEIEFKVISTGAADDMYRVTNMAKSTMTRYGFCPERVGHFSFPEGGDNDFVVQKPYSEKLEKVIDEEVNTLVEKVYERTKALLTEHWDAVKAVAERLLEKEEITAEELIEILGPKPHPSVELEKYLAAMEESRSEEAAMQSDDKAEEGEAAKEGDVKADPAGGEGSAKGGDGDAKSGGGKK